MCMGRSSAPPAPVTPPPIVRSQPIEDMAPKIEIAGEEGLDETGKKLNKDLGTGTIQAAGLQIPQ